MTTPRMAMLTCLSLASCLAIAGAERWFLAHPPLLALVVTTLVLGVVALFTEGHLGQSVREDLSNRWVIAAFVVLGLLSAYLALSPTGATF